MIVIRVLIDSVDLHLACSFYYSTARETNHLAIEVEMIRLLIVADQSRVRKGLYMRLAAEWDFSVIGEAPDGETALDLAISLCPDVVIIDVDMLCIDGMAIASMLHSACPEVSIVILSIRDDTFTCERAGEVGAAAFVAKSMPADALLMAIRRVAHFM